MLLCLPSILTYAEILKERGYRLRVLVFLGPRRILLQTTNPYQRRRYFS